MSTMRPTDDLEHPRYVADELLLTFSAARPTAPLSADDKRVQTLLQRAYAIATGSTDGSKAQEGEHAAALEEREEHGATTRGRKVREQLPLFPPPPLTLPLKLGPPSSASHRRDRDHVKVAVDRVNRELSSLREGGVAVTSAIPNWILSSSAGSPHTGPGTLPSVAPSGTWEFEMGRKLAQRRPSRKLDPKKRVIVAVLDTWPGNENVRKAARRCRGNKLMKYMATRGAISVWQPSTPRDDVPPRETFADPDHGLFVAGIIHSIAPQAEIHVLQILDTYGLGSTKWLLEALDHCLKLARSGRRVVVNMSLYLLIPPDDAAKSIWDIWFDRDPDYRNRTPQQNAALLELLDEPIEQRITLLLDAGAVVIAAAGNDAITYGKNGHPNHLQPRLPADYDSVLSVVATDDNGKIANYSNAADRPMTGNCIATFGGQGVPGTTQGTVVVPGTDGVVGLYTELTINRNGDNKHGWAYWSGTSFATPIISGVAANLLATTPTLTPRGVMTQMLAMADDTDATLGCPYLPVSQKQTRRLQWGIPRLRL